MATDIETSRRRIVPRWRNFRTALGTGELDPAEVRRVNATAPDSFVIEKEQEWRANHSLLFATDFLGAAYVMEQGDLATEAAEFVLQPDSGASAVAKSIASKILNIPDQAPKQEGPNPLNRQEMHGRVRSSKIRAIEQPRNAFVWADLARLYTILGLEEQAKRTMQIACYLAPWNRHVLRSATRLRLHFHHPDEAHALLRKAETTRTDPWLLAAEIAVCSVLGKPSRFLKLGKTLLGSNNFNPFQVSELACALGSVELWNDNEKKANKLFCLALREPNDNSLAQVVWATKYVSIEPLQGAMLSGLRAFEAQALSNFFAARWEESLQCSKLWLIDEPFSRRPAIHSSFLTSTIFEDHVASADIASEALSTIPEDPTLLNNFAFALAHQGKLDEARRSLKRVRIEECEASTKACVLATSGLIEYRSGKPVNGRALYEKAINVAGAAKLSALKARARLYLAREETIAQTTSAETLRQEALEESSKLKEPDIKVLAERLARLKVKQ